MSNHWLNVKQIIDLTVELKSSRSERHIKTALRNEVFGHKWKGRWRATHEEVVKWIGLDCPTVPPGLEGSQRTLDHAPPGDIMDLADASKYLFLTPHEVRMQVKAGRLRRYGEHYHITDLRHLIGNYGEERFPIYATSSMTGREDQIGELVNGEPVWWHIADLEEFSRERVDTEDRKVVWPKKG